MLPEHPSKDCQTHCQFFLPNNSLLNQQLSSITSTYKFIFMIFCSLFVCIPLFLALELLVLIVYFYLHSYFCSACPYMWQCFICRLHLLDTLWNGLANKVSKFNELHNTIILLLCTGLCECVCVLQLKCHCPKVDNAGCVALWWVIVLSGSVRDPVPHHVLLSLMAGLWSAPCNLSHTSLPVDGFFKG